MIITLTPSPLNISGNEIYPLPQEELDLLHSIGVLSKRNKTYILSLNYREYTLLCLLLKTGHGGVFVLWPSFKLPRRPYPVFVYLYAVARYLSCNLSLRAVAAEVRKKFGLSTFSHTTISGVLRKLVSQLASLESATQVLKPVLSPAPAHFRRHWTEENRKNFERLLNFLSPVLIHHQDGSLLAYLFFILYGRFLL